MHIMKMARELYRCWSTLMCPILVLMVCTAESHGQAAAEQGRSVVVWISVDGVRPDYIDRAETPLLDRFMREGAYSREFVPVFPTLTFPTHVSQATGVLPGEHGVTANSFYDSRTRQTYFFPQPEELLEAEPIWHTAARQGVRSAVFDWPLSHAQSGRVQSDHFADAFDRNMTDAERMQRLIDVWREDEGEEPLRLIMGYMVGPDVAGHGSGPDSPEVEEAMAEADALLGNFLDEAKQSFEEKMTPQDRLFVIVSTDHGMSPVQTMVNLERLIEVDLPRDVRRVTSGNIAHIHLDRLPWQQRREMAEQILENVSKHEFADAYARDDLPEHWNYAHPTRTGDVVIVLKPGHTFSGRIPEVTFPVERVGSPLGMHGYPIEEDPNMMGIAVIWSHPAPFGGIDLGRVDSLHMHDVVARLLEIEPAEAATEAPRELLQRLALEPIPAAASSGQ